MVLHQTIKSCISIHIWGGSIKTKGRIFCRTPQITEWDQMGILGLSSRMFNECTTRKEGLMNSSSSSYLRRESVTTKVM